MSFGKRIADAVVFERKVLAALADRGWSAEPFGQGQLTDGMHDLIRAINTPVRWMPDIIAAKKFANRNVLIFVDAKAGEKWRETGNHAIETAAVETAAAWAEFSHCPTWFAFSDGSVTTPDRIKTLGIPGSFRGSGSGTPFLLIGTAICEPFDAIFGQLVVAAAS